jgi:hypothetical protein
MKVRSGILSMAGLSFFFNLVIFFAVGHKFAPTYSIDHHVGVQSAKNAIKMPSLREPKL